MLYEKEALDAWFKKKEEDSYETYHHTLEEDDEDVYAVALIDMEDFTDWLRLNEIDLIGFPCMIGTNGIWFSSEDLEKARHY